MAITQEEVATRALRRLRVVSREETPSGNDMRDAITALSGMVQSWALKGYDIDLGTILAGEGLHAPIVVLLAVRIAPDYGITPLPLMLREADEALNQIMAFAWVHVAATFDQGLVHIPGNRFGVDGAADATAGGIDGGTA